MKPTIRRWLALATASMGLYLGLSVCGLAQDDQGQNDRGHGINVGVPIGTYIFQNTGYVTVDGNLVPFRTAGQLTFSANGKITGISSFSGQGFLFSRSVLLGSFKVNGDGSVSATVTDAQGDVSHADVYPTPDGNTLTLFSTDPGTVVSGFATRGR